MILGKKHSYETDYAGAYPASVIAYDFVKRGIDEGNPVTQMKLQKLIFFAHGLHLASQDAPLTKEYFQAWKFGPVIPNVYHEYKLYGSAPIIETDLILFQSKRTPDTDCIDKESLEMIDVAWQTLNKFTAIQLSNWTHNADSPWTKHYKQDEQYVIIPNEDIKMYFDKFVKK